MPSELEAATWDLYLLCEQACENREAFNPAGEMAALRASNQPASHLDYEAYAIVDERESSHMVAVAKLGDSGTTSLCLAVPHPISREDLLFEMEPFVGSMGPRGSTPAELDIRTGCSIEARKLCSLCRRGTAGFSGNTSIPAKIRILLVYDSPEARPKI
ncbi:MAG: hypothetical protein MZV49_05915 [Rhodopseudomonas palustris]|nr:hypothetical protein [Rhodopseudomonas palustris]